MRILPKKPRWRRATMAVVAVMGLAAVTVSTPSLADTFTAGAEESAKGDKKPVYNEKFADPAVTWTGEEYVGAATGPFAPIASAPKANGPWKHVKAGLKRLPKWASEKNGVWAPEIQHVKDDTYVMFYAPKVAGLADDKQRCIGVAVSTTGATGKYTPVDKKPVVCPAGAKHPGYAKPKTRNLGLIDASTFESKDGRNILLFKSQRPNPGTTLWSVEMNSSWTKPTGSAQKLLHRPKGQIENPEMVVRGNSYYLFASYDDYIDCTYKTVWLKNDSPRSGWKLPKGFPKNSTTSGKLISSRDGMCGPGGMTITEKGGNQQFFLHAYKDSNHDGKQDSQERRMYAGKLKFKSNGVPIINYFYKP